MMDSTLLWRYSMWALLCVVVICATVLYWSHKYLQPYHKPEAVKEDMLQVDERDEAEAINFDNIIAEIYNRLDE